MRFVPHSCHILSPSKTVLMVTAHRLAGIILLILVQATLQLQRDSTTYILLEDTHPVIRAIGASRTACKHMFYKKICSSILTSPPPPPYYHHHHHTITTDTTTTTTPPPPPLPPSASPPPLPPPPPPPPPHQHHQHHQQQHHRRSIYQVRAGVVSGCGVCGMRGRGDGDRGAVSFRPSLAACGRSLQL